VVIGFSILRGHLSRWRTNRQVAAHEEAEGYHYHFGVGHTHIHSHTHLPEEKGHDHQAKPQGGQAMNWRNLLALGISGGLLPCPSALVLLLSAIALRQVGVGLVLIVVFSIGLASVLTGIGLILVYAGRFLERLPVRHTTLTRRLLPAASAAFITVAGLIITVRALIETGVI
jgi:ABC-type nickel/cobalt efflux system permease component RcnA